MQKDKPKLSVLMSVYNGEGHIREAIDSILNQTFSDFEFIIVDDGSFDGTPKILQEYKGKDSRISVIAQENKGLSCSLNKALSLSNGEYIARHDSDDISETSRFEKQISFLENNPDVVLLGTNYSIIDDCGNLTETTKVPHEDEDIRKSLIKANCFGHGTVVIRKDELVDAGGYDENFRFAQDYDLWLRLSEKYKLANLEEPLYFWRRNNEGASIQNKCEQEEYARIAVQNALIRKNRKRAKKENPLVSVIVPTYNRPEMLENAIKSILGQTCVDFEIIVVNDAGKDVSGIIEKFKNNRLIYISHDKNKGLSVARNTGIKNANGNYISYLDDDDVFYPEHLSVLINALKEGNSKVAISRAYRAIQAISPDGHYRTFLKETPYPEVFDRDLILVENIAPINSIMHEKDCVEETGFFDEKLKVFEDWDFQIRLSKQYEFCSVPQYTSEVRTRLDNSNMTFSNWQKFLDTKKVIYEKHESYVQNRPEIITLQNKSLANLKKMADSSISLSEYLLTDREAKISALENKIKILEQKFINEQNSIPYRIYNFFKCKEDKIKKFIKSVSDKNQ